ncbi:MAG: glycerol-3-phosphate dehydrogenase, partial [Flavobacteriaceae bacterium]|nr:glycerol-3-phosphate dehydrogenase [Flavobacteriaceae bacterium]
FKQEFDEVATDKTPLTENPFKDSNEVKTYIKTISKRIDSEGLSPVVATYLVHNYGKQTDRILEIFEKIDKKEAPFRLMVAELKYCLTHEMVCTPLDFFIRRTGRMYFDKPSVASSKESILAAFSSHFKWNQKTAEYHKKQLDITLQNTVEFV